MSVSRCPRHPSAWMASALASAFACAMAGAPIAIAFGEGTATLPVALDGYCVVSLHNQRQWVSGREQFAAAFDGRWYYFAGERERAIFAAAPETYAPVLSGDCPVTFAETGERVAGQLRHGVSYGDRLFFFANAQRAAEFQRDPASFVDADLFQGGVCPVTYAATGRRVLGDPATALTFAGGRRIFFVNAAARREFLAAPSEYVEELSSAAAPSTTIAHRSADRLAPSGVPRGGDPASAGAVIAAPRGAGPRAGDSAPAAVSSTEPLLNGYCPVSVWTQPANPWVQGRYDQRRSVDDMVFMPAGPAERETFNADPALYIPALAGNCVVTYVDTGKRVRGSIYHSVVDRDIHRIFLCADEAAATRLRENPDKYVGADLAAGGKCVVSRRDTGTDVPGNPLIGVWYEGQRYQFVDEAARTKFLADPVTYAAPIGE